MPTGADKASITLERCFNHLQREAAAFCLECRRAFCRECVTEHDGRVMCAACLRKLAVVRSPVATRFRVLLLPVAALAGFMVAWVTFFSLGRLLLRMPDSFHEGTFWNKD